MKVEINILETEAKRNGYPFDGFKDWLNDRVPGDKPLFRAWDITTSYTSKGEKVLTFFTVVPNALKKRLQRGSK